MDMAVEPNDATPPALKGIGAKSCLDLSHEMAQPGLLVCARSRVCPFIERPS